mgnify:CR=1 FL=1|tara:strand:+ start:4007 stop:4231 length:225 start_codon:yes stop_codon:yes gene_type:complete
MAKKKTKKDEIVDGVKFPSKDELRKMYSTPDDLRLEALKERLKEIQDKWSAMTPEEQKIVSEAKKEINEINNKK